MPVQIPSVQRFAAQAPSQPNLIETQVPNVAGNVAKVSNAALSAANKFIKKTEQDTIDLEGQAITNQFVRRQTAKLEGDSTSKTPGLRHLKGDPTEAFNKYDKSSEEDFQKAIDSYTGTGRSKAKFIKSISARANDIYNKRQVYYGNQRARYIKDVSNDSVGTLSSTAMESTAGIKVGDPNSMAGVTSALDRMAAQRVEEAIYLNDIVPGDSYKHVSDDGEITKLDIGTTSKRQMSKDASTTVLGGINVLVSGKKTAEAQMLMDAHGDRLDGVDKAKANKLIKDSGIDDAAMALVEKTQNMSAADSSKYIKNSKAPFDVQVKANSIRNGFTKSMDAQIKRESTEVYNDLHEMISEKQRSVKPYDSIEGLESNAKFKQLIHKVTTAREREALYSLVEHPKTSVLSVVQEYDKIFQSNNLKNMKPADRDVYLGQMNKADAAKRLAWWHTANKETEAGQRSRDTNYTKKLIKLQGLDGLRKVGKRSKRMSKKNQRLDKMLTERAAQRVEEQSIPFKAADVVRQAKEDYLEVKAEHDRIENQGFSLFGFTFGGPEPSAPAAPKTPLKPGEVTSIKQIPKDDYRRIMSELKAAKKPVTPKNILDAYKGSK